MTKKITFITIALMLCGILPAQNHARALATADTTGFAVNKHDGWQLFNARVAVQNTDSVAIGFIIQHARNINLQEEQTVGRIKRQELLPDTDKTLTVTMPQGTYRLRIEKNGRCHLQLISGTLPDTDPVVIPIMAVYALKP